jgi:glycopeptide antibiotics resistance protein
LPFVGKEKTKASVSIICHPFGIFGLSAIWQKRKNLSFGFYNPFIPLGFLILGLFAIWREGKNLSFGFIILSSLRDFFPFRISIHFRTLIYREPFVSVSPLPYVKTKKSGKDS